MRLSWTARSQKKKKACLSIPKIHTTIPVEPAVSGLLSQPNPFWYHRGVHRLSFLFFPFFSARPTPPIPPIRTCNCSSSNPPLQVGLHLVAGRSGSLFSRIITPADRNELFMVMPRGITYLGLVLMLGLIASDPWRKKSHRNCLGQTEK